MGTATALASGMHLPRSLAMALLASLVSSGCWVTIPEIDAKINGDSTPPTTTVPPDCTPEERLRDGGFEGGSPSEAWAEYSLLFGTPICSETCDESGTATPFEGRYWAWFGGAESYEEARLEQLVNFGSQGVATLTFQLAVPQGSSNAADQLGDLVDDGVVFELSAADGAIYSDYAQVLVDVGDFADGAVHQLSMLGVTYGDGVSNFFVDNVSLQGCP